MGKEKADKLKKLKSIMLSGENSPSYLGGISKNRRIDNILFIKFKSLIRKRDNQICMLCGIHKEKLNRCLDVHHINYNKYNDIPKNCVSLCHSCHQKTGFNRRHWFDLFRNILKEKYNYDYDDKIIITKYHDKEVQYG